MLTLINRKHLKSGGKLYVSAGNVAFLRIRLELLPGSFNYGRRGILDLTHRRLFTVDSFRRLLNNAGFRIDRIIGFRSLLPHLASERSRIFDLADRLLAKLARA